MSRWVYSYMIGWLHHRKHWVSRLCKEWYLSWHRVQWGKIRWILDRLTLKSVNINHKTHVVQSLCYRFYFSSQVFVDVDKYFTNVRKMYLNKRHMNMKLLNAPVDRSAWVSWFPSSNRGHQNTMSVSFSFSF